MFEKLKKRISNDRISSKSITAFFIFGAIVLVFVFFGFPTHQNGGGVGSAAQVNDTYISVADLRNELGRLEQMYSQFMGGQFNSETQRQFLRQQAIDNLVRNEVMSQSAQRFGIWVTDYEVRDFVTKEMPVFQKDGRFHRDAYLQILQANRLNPGEFEDKVRKDRRTQRVRRMFEAATVPLNLEENIQKEMKEQKLNYQFVKIDKEKLTQQSTPSSSEVAARLKDSDFMKKVEEDFNRNKASYSQPEQVRAQHLLIKFDLKKPESENEALKKITALKAQALAGDFGKLATANSEDIGSKTKGGDLGYFAHGAMTPEFEKAAFASAVGAVVGPVKTPFGYHLIKVMDKKAAKEAKIEDVQNKIAGQLIGQEGFDQQMKSLEDILRAADTAKLEAWLKTANLKWEETGLFEMGADAIPKLESPTLSQAVREIPLDQPLLKRLVRDGDARYVLKFKEVRSETAKTDAKPPINPIPNNRSFELLGQWMEGETKSAKIELNQQILSDRM